MKVEAWVSCVLQFPPLCSGDNTAQRAAEGSETEWRVRSLEQGLVLMKL